MISNHNEDNKKLFCVDNTLCRVDVSSQGAGEIDINRIREMADKAKIKWINAREKLPNTYIGKLYLVERHCYLPDWTGGGYKEFKKVYLAEYIASQKIWQIKIGEDTFDYCNALVDELEVPGCITSVPRWAYIPGDKEDEDEM